MTLRRKREMTCFSIACMCLGLLLWARLILVTGYPRTAVATPLVPVVAAPQTPMQPRAQAPADLVDGEAVP